MERRTALSSPSAAPEEHSSKIKTPPPPTPQICDPVRPSVSQSDPGSCQSARTDLYGLFSTRTSEGGYTIDGTKGGALLVVSGANYTGGHTLG
ncbi:MAG: hypothetical protein ACFFBD_06085 [Candidatus Hodarchaeota archaeon]